MTMPSIAAKFDVSTGFFNTIDGRITSSKETRNGINPATGQPNAAVPVATQQDVDEAVAAARRAFLSWSKVQDTDRVKAVLAFADALDAHTAAFATLLTQEQGKPTMFGAAEVALSSRWLRGAANLKLEEEVLEQDEEKKVIVRYTPLGVAVGIVPWNFPLYLACGKIGPALVVGNTIIIKPSPFTPYCALKMGELAQQFFPPGVVQVLSGNDNLGPWLTAHPGVDKVSFTGSTFTGKKVMASAATTLKRVTLELGGNDPAIVCSDIDIDAVATKARQIGQLIFLNSGQVCVAIKRVYVHESIYDKFRDAIVATIKTLKVAEGNVEGAFIGPVQNEVQYNRIKTFFNDIEKENWKVVLGGKIDEGPGFFINPTIIDRPADNSRIVTEEPFGPIAPLLAWKDEEDVIARSNDSKMGLGASVWSQDLEQAERIARRLEAGTVWVNTHTEPDPMVPFGGHKESGIGQEWGVNGLKSYCNAQSLILKKKV